MSHRMKLVIHRFFLLFFSFFFHFISLILYELLIRHLYSSNMFESNFKFLIKVITKREKKYEKVFFSEYIPYDVLMTFDPVLDCTANHNLLLLAQAIWIGQVWWNFEGAAPFSLWYENVAIFLLIEFCMG